MVTGIIMSCYYVGYVLRHLVAPPLLRQVGHIRVFAALAAVASVAILIQGLLRQPVRLGRAATASRALLRRHLRGRRELAERSREPRQPRPLVRGIHDGLYVGLGAAQFLLVSRTRARPTRSCWSRC